MTEEQKRQMIEAMVTSNRIVMDVICPPGTATLLIGTWLVGIPGLIWLYWVTGWFG